MCSYFSKSTRQTVVTVMVMVMVMVNKGSCSGNDA